uniref:IGFBP N-terminal domain-containing protein n=1 Tax=Globodera pallida TaxID=36090 RepID=A0A183CCY7_GLOPA
MSFLNALPILLTILFGIILQNGHFADASCCCCCKPCCCGCTCVGPCQCCNPPLLIKLPRTCPCCCKCCCCKPCCCGGCCCGCCGGGGGRKKRSIVLRSAIEVAKTGKPASPAVKMVASSCRPVTKCNCNSATVNTDCPNSASVVKNRARRMAFGATFLFA